MPTAWSAILSPEMWPTFVFITARLVGLFSVAPLWSMGALPRTARAAILVVMALVLLPGAPHVRMPEQVLELPVPIAMEVLLGLSIGLVAAVVVQGAGLAGELVSLQMGLQLGPALAPMVEFEASGVAQLHTMLATVIYVMAGGHLMMLQGIADSLHAVPPGSPMELGEGARAITAIAGTLFSSAVRTGGPVIVALLVTNVALAILSRAVPQLNAMMVSFPLTIAVGLIMIGAALPITAGTLDGWVHELPGRIAVVTGAFRALPAGP
jgi:flagellar biosynthetic protein FliR